MISIVHLISGLDTGGAEAMLAKLVAAMDRTRFRNVVVSMTAPGPVGERIRAAGVPLETLDLRRGWVDPRGLMRLNRVLRRERPAVLQTWLYHADLLGTLAKRFTPVPRLAWNLRCSDMDMDRYSWLSRRVLGVLARFSAIPDVVMVNAQAGLGVHRTHGYRPRRWEVIPNGFDVDRFRPDEAAGAQLRGELRVPDGGILIGVPARFDPMKDHATFLDAASRLARERPEARFLLIGRGLDGGNPDAAALLRGRGLDGRVHLLGERGDMPRLLAGLDVAALSSAFGEGFPNVLGEAMACGTPCVSTAVGDAPVIIGDTGLIVPPRDPARLAAALGEMCGMGAEERRRLGTAARARIVANYALPIIVERYEALYAELAGGN